MKAGKKTAKGAKEGQFKGTYPIKATGKIYARHHPLKQRAIAKIYESTLNHEVIRKIYVYGS